MRSLALLVATGVALSACGGGGGGGSTCSASNCVGCCLNGACQAGTTAAGCGRNGAACVQCSTNQVCRADQACGVDPESTWRVQPVSASIASSNNGSAWDGDGSGPDVKVYGWCPPFPSSASATPEASDTYQASWTSGGCTAKAKDLLASGWTFQVFDIDLVSDDTITAQLNVTLGEAQFIQGGFSLPPTGGLTAMSVQLVKQ